MKNYFISDLHLFHENALRFDQRPFDTVDEMNAIIYNNWNSVVTNEDFVYILGDISMKVNEEIIALVSKLKGHKILIKGNHDKLTDHRYRTLFDDIVDYAEISVGIKQPNNQTRSFNLVLSHYPILMWKNQHHNYIHLYGHVHNSVEESVYQEALKQLKISKKKRLPELDETYFDENFLAFNVGCMMPYINYRPQTLEHILKYGKIYVQEEQYKNLRIK